MIVCIRIEKVCACAELVGWFYKLRVNVVAVVGLPYVMTVSDVNYDNVL